MKTARIFHVLVWAEDHATDFRGETTVHRVNATHSIRTSDQSELLKATSAAVTDLAGSSFVSTELKP